MLNPYHSDIQVAIIHTLNTTLTEAVFSLVVKRVTFGERSETFLWYPPVFLKYKVIIYDF